ncbi:hypothetical protein CBL_03511 [Carabus blaptoides fortunei]
MKQLLRRAIFILQSESTKHCPLFSGATLKNRGENTLGPTKINTYVEEEDDGEEITSQVSDPGDLMPSRTYDYCPLRSWRTHKILSRRFLFSVYCSLRPVNDGVCGFVVVNCAFLDTYTSFMA